MTHFHSFVVFAEMRTGSNFLEANLNAFPGLACVGEAFNPHFPGYPNKEDCLGITLKERDKDPMRLVQEVKAQDKLTGFRFFHDHDARVLDPILNDPGCAKIILTRNPADSYVSWKIAQETGQWKMTDVRRRKDSSAVTFDAEEFEAHLEQLQAFQVKLLNALQVTGQTAFYVAYEDLQDVAVMNGLARWLGQSDQLEKLDDKLKRQNPAPISQKVDNFGAMEQALARLDRFNLTRTPNFEPRRGPNVPAYQAAAKTPLLYMPVRGEIDGQIGDWLAALDGADKKDLPGKFNQKQLRQWMLESPGFRSFAVIRHPLARAHSVFCNRIVRTGRPAYRDIRQTLRQKYKLPIPGKNAQGPYPIEDHRQAFGMFLDFLKANLSGQTSIRIDQSWASQSTVLEGMGQFCLPDQIIRETDIAKDLPHLARSLGHANPPSPEAIPEDTPHALSDIYDAELEQKAAQAYHRDYLLFGFGPWR